jgi:mannose-6-phosphate isomerase-like protein (cupin superfamily)
LQSRLYGILRGDIREVTRKHLRFGRGFSVALANRRAQAATMVLAPGDHEGGPDNRHRGSDQWLYVISGTGSALVGGKRQTLKAGTLLLIERGVTHEIRNTGSTPLKTLNLYVPPAYTGRGDPLPRGRK